MWERCLYQLPAWDGLNCFRERWAKAKEYVLDEHFFQWFTCFSLLHRCWDLLAPEFRTDEWTVGCTTITHMISVTNGSMKLIHQVTLEEAHAQVTSRYSHTRPTPAVSKTPLTSSASTEISEWAVEASHRPSLPLQPQMPPYFPSLLRWTLESVDGWELNHEQIDSSNHCASTLSLSSIPCSELNLRFHKSSVSELQVKNNLPHTAARKVTIRFCASYLQSTLSYHRLVILSLSFTLKWINTGEAEIT